MASGGLLSSNHQSSDVPTGDSNFPRPRRSSWESMSDLTNINREPYKVSARQRGSATPPLADPYRINWRSPNDEDCSLSNCDDLALHHTDEPGHCLLVASRGADEEDENVYGPQDHPPRYLTPILSVQASQAATRTWGNWHHALDKDDAAFCCGTMLNVDWVFLVVEIAVRLILIALGILLWIFYPPFVRRVWPNDWDKYAFPFSEEETFPGRQTAILATIMTLSMLSLFLMLLHKVLGWRRQYLIEETIFFLLGISLSVLFGFVGSEMVKRMYGRLRPDFLARCFGQSRLEDWLDKWGTKGLDQIPEIPDCSHSPYSARVLQDGRMSFPSEHSCLTSAVFVFNALWSYGKLCLFENVGALRLVVPFAFLTFPVAVAVSRTSDYRHHATDVVAGCLLGIVCATVSFIFYFQLRMRPLTTTVYAIYEDNDFGNKAARFREVEAAKINILNTLGGVSGRQNGSSTEAGTMTVVV
eukprot:Blabericola_migrator_1__11553@NODE_690_length_6863_cov_119_324897_g501_i0_p3_GENE_NODE_690_length_6863_cov_119_324897_g501_i0NODE_690_length_6863_cov_119_324897_g501_i0_p3_ORF_typecomplete_len472_score51_09PAP2/PF01569_21/87PAP2/PF01569_21/3_2e02PAP2/PF01569_21/3e25PAP2_3/PF14378_6/0_0015DUF4271/PF14093_6/0_011DUF4271/PF14093_6/2_3e03DUF3169/PF11368_8/0_32DUF3169/PF11368_8/1_5e02MscS_TM/PF12794_7/3_8MscS_TM/PF12794_7/7FtsX/PF02687_21/2_9e02FtsX/PF02687_21/0_26_NODE_690_length_6863_cov_119_324897